MVQRSSGKPAGLKIWVTVLLKKERFYKLTYPDLMPKAYTFSDGIALEWIVKYMDTYPDVTSTEVFQQLNA